MTTLDRAQVVRVSLSLTRNGTGWMTAKKAPRLGRNGRILRVMVREDATDTSGTAAVLYVAHDALTATPDDLTFSARWPWGPLLQALLQTGAVAETGPWP